MHLLVQSSTRAWMEFDGTTGIRQGEAVENMAKTYPHMSAIYALQEARVCAAILLPQAQYVVHMLVDA
jgi:hypothetical protein